MADNQALGELAAQDRYDPIVPALDVLPRSTQVLGGLADLGGVDPVVLPQNPNPLADNPFSHYVAQKLFGLGQNAVSALSVPGEVWKGNLDPTSDEGMNRAIGLAQMITEAPRGGGAGPGTVLGSGIRAYHGSPYDFDRFDMSKIGTGEGAQAYGHGLYFAGNEAVAKAYRDKLEFMNQRPTTIPGPFGDIPILEKDPSRPGRMYEVNINAHPDEFLDWDKPLGQQPKALGIPDLGMLESRQKEMLTNLLELEKTGKQMTPEGAALRKQIDAYANSINRYHVGSRTAADYYQKMAMESGGIEQASKTLNDAGIPGIKYLDQGSRTNINTNDLRGSISMFEVALRRHPGDEMLTRNLQQAKDQLAAAERGATSNYVVFNDKLIDILRKYGLVGLTAGAGATAAGQQMDNSAPFGMIGAVPVTGGAMGSLARQDQYQQ